MSLLISCGDREENQRNGILGECHESVSRSRKPEKAKIPYKELRNAEKPSIGASGSDGGFIMTWLLLEAIRSVCRPQVRPVQYTLHWPFPLLRGPMTSHMR